MIKEIRELNFPAYATLSHATVTLQDMAEKTITTQVKIDGGITPDFSYDWEVEYMGERYVHPLRKPQAMKDNTSIMQTIDLTFEHWAQRELKRYMFFEYASTESGTAIADKWVVPLRLNLGDFCQYLAKVLEYWYGDKITVKLNDKWEYDPEPKGVDINYSFVWDVLLKIHELYGARWTIEPHGDTEHYVIRIGYGGEEMSHIFEYGFDGGLLKVERQVQSDEIRNMLLGRGGEKNVPYRYFKDVDPQNPSFPADPDWIPELRNIYFDRLRGKTFRDYIKGWKTNPRRQLTETDGSPITPYPHDKTVNPIAVEPYDEEYAKESFAYQLGHTDEKFNPVEYVADRLVTVDLSVVAAPKSSIAMYGMLMGGLDDNDEIYPTIQGIVVDPYGRVDEVVEVERITSDDVEGAADSEASVASVAGAETTEKAIEPLGTRVLKLVGGNFEIPQGRRGNFLAGVLSVEYGTYDVNSKWEWDGSGFMGGKLTHITLEGDMKENDGTIIVGSPRVRIFNVSTGEERSASGIPAGLWRYELEVNVENSNQIQMMSVTVACETPKVQSADGNDLGWSSTWNVWVKNIWGTSKRRDESDAEYAERVWGPILGGRDGSEAKMIFSDGMLSMSEDYEFVITNVPRYERKRCVWESVVNGNIVKHEYESEWRITLGKSDADLESTGLYIPSTKREAKAGDHFFFIGIELPHQYVLWAEDRLDDYKKDALREVSDIKPTWVVTPDKVRLSQRENANGYMKSLLDQLRVGNTLRLADKRFIINEANETAAYETLYLQSITYSYNEPTNDDAGLIPDVELVLNDRYETAANPVTTLSGEVNSLARQLGSISNVEQIVRAVGDKQYLRKDGIPDRSMSATEFASIVSSLGFRSGITGGKGWGMYKDENGHWVVEADRFKARMDMEVNSMVSNQIETRSGMIIYSSAHMEITRVVEMPDGYVCYFDQRGGTVDNTFKVDDVAYCNRFTLENEELKYYKRRVSEVTQNSVTLTKNLDVDGTGIPSEGDVIVCYGNYHDRTRRYVMITDVVGGGYMRFLEGLDSVKSEGQEYFFVGRQSAMNNEQSRWFVGNQDSYIEYVNGEFMLNNVKLSVNSSIGDRPLSELSETLAGVDYLREALRQNTTVEAGLILTSLIKLGMTIPGVGFVPTSGINGVIGTDESASPLAIWAGGDMIDPEVQKKGAAAFGIRMDGTAFAANNLIRFLLDHVAIGDNLQLTQSGLILNRDGNESLAITNEDLYIENGMVSPPRKVINRNLTKSISGQYTETNSGTLLNINVPRTEVNLGPLNAGDVIDMSMMGYAIFTPEAIVREPLSPDALYFTLIERGSGKTIWSGSMVWVVTDRHEIGDTMQYTIESAGDAMQVELPLDGDYTLHLYHDAGSGSVWISTRLGMAQCSVAISITTKLQSKTQMSPNGFVSAWGSALLAAYYNNIVARVANHGLRVTEDGVYGLTDNGTRWRKIKFTYED